MRDITHRHRIIPGHLGGTYVVDNVVRLTIEKHAEAHLELFAVYGSKYDYIAWKTLSGQIQGQEARLEAMRESGRRMGIKSGVHLKGNKNLLGYRHTEESNRKNREAHLGNQHALGCRWSHTAEAKQKISAARKGRSPSDEARKRMIGAWVVRGERQCAT